MDGCPIIWNFIHGVLGRNPEGAMNKDVIYNLNEVLLRSSQEHLGMDALRARSARAYELAYVSVLSQDLNGLNIPPDPRVSLETLDVLMERLRVRLEDAIVENVDIALGAEVNRKSPVSMKRMANLRLHQGGLQLTSATETIRLILARQADHLTYGVMGSSLASVCASMVIGLTKQLMFAEELLHTGTS